MPLKRMFPARPGVRPANAQGLQNRNAGNSPSERPSGAVRSSVAKFPKAMPAPVPVHRPMSPMQAKVAPGPPQSGGRGAGVIAPSAVPTFPKSALMSTRQAPPPPPVSSVNPPSPKLLLSHPRPLIQPKHLMRPAFQEVTKPQSMARPYFPRKDASARGQSALAPHGIIQRSFASDRGRPTGSPLPDKLEYGKSEMATTCAIIVYDQSMMAVAEQTFRSGNGAHAEEHAIGYLQNRVAAGTLVKQPNAAIQDYQVVFFVSKSPCSSTAAIPTRTGGGVGCHERLMALRDNGITFGAITVTFYVIIAATKPYQPAIAGAKAQSRDNMDDFDDAANGSSAFAMMR